MAERRKSVQLGERLQGAVAGRRASVSKGAAVFAPTPQALAGMRRQSVNLHNPAKLAGDSSGNDFKKPNSSRRASTNHRSEDTAAVNAMIGIFGSGSGRSQFGGLEPEAEIEEREFSLGRSTRKGDSGNRAVEQLRADVTMRFDTLEALASKQQAQLLKIEKLLEGRDSRDSKRAGKKRGRASADSATSRASRSSRGSRSSEASSDSDSGSSAEDLIVPEKVDPRTAREARKSRNNMNVSSGGGDDTEDGGVAEQPHENKEETDGSNEQRNSETAKAPPKGFAPVTPPALVGVQLRSLDRKGQRGLSKLETEEPPKSTIGNLVRSMSSARSPPSSQKGQLSEQGKNAKDSQGGLGDVTESGSPGTERSPRPSMTQKLVQAMSQKVSSLKDGDQRAAGSTSRPAPLLSETRQRATTGLQLRSLKQDIHSSSLEKSRSNMVGNLKRAVSTRLSASSVSPSPSAAEQPKPTESGMSAFPPMTEERSIEAQNSGEASRIQSCKGFMLACIHTLFPNFARRLALHFQSNDDDEDAEDVDEQEMARIMHETNPESLLEILVIPVNSFFRKSWDTMMMLLVLYELAVIPLMVSFANIELPPPLHALDTFIYVCFCMDVFMNFNTSFYIGEQEILNRGAIAHRYTRSNWFWTDLISCFPAMALRRNKQNDAVVRILYLTRCARMGNIIKQMDELVFASAFRLLRLLVFIAYNAHWSACVWNLVMQDELKELLTGNGAEDGYTLCIWCATSLLLMLGSFSPITHLETYMSCVLAIYGACLQACVFGSIAVLIAGLDAEETQFHRKLIEVAQRMRNLSLPDVLRKRVIAYYTMLWQLNRSGSSNMDHFISELSPSLQTDIRLCLFRDMFTKIPFFSSPLLNPILVEALVMKLQTVVYLRGDIIMRKGETGDWMGFIGRGGKVAILDPTVPDDADERKVIKVLTEGEYIGEISLLFNIKRIASVEAITVVRMHVLTNADYKVVTQEYPADAKTLRKEMERFLVTKKRYTAAQLESMKNQAVEELKQWKANKSPRGRPGAGRSPKTGRTRAPRQSFAEHLTTQCEM